MFRTLVSFYDFVQLFEHKTGEGPKGSTEAVCQSAVGNFSGSKVEGKVAELRAVYFAKEFFACDVFIIDSKCADGLNILG